MPAVLVASAAALMWAQTAAATTSTGVEAVTISQAAVDGVDYITREITIAPGGSTGWHYHDGRVSGVIRDGTLTTTRRTAPSTASIRPALPSPRPAEETTCTSAATSNPYR